MFCLWVNSAYPSNKQSKAFFKSFTWKKLFKKLKSGHIGLLL